jgi:hypothetical protein
MKAKKKQTIKLKRVSLIRLSDKLYGKAICDGVSHYRIKNGVPIYEGECDQ